MDEVFKFVKTINGIECFIIGVNSLKELKEIASSWNNLNQNNKLIGDFSWNNAKDLDPRNWV